jgi:hypothetical protein
VQRARDELLARAALARDEHGRRHVGDALEHGVDAENGLALADDAEPRARSARRLLARRLRAGEIARAQRLANDRANLGLIERFGDVVESACFQGFDGVVDGAVRREDDDGQFGIGSQRLPQELEPVHLGHPQVGDDEVDVVFA